MQYSISFLVCVLIAVSASAKELPKDTFDSKAHGFSIQAPVLSLDRGEGYQLAVFALPLEQGFSGNVNIQRQAFSGSIDEYDSLTLSQFSQAGFTVHKREQNGREIRYEYSGNVKGASFHWYSRVVFSKPYVYLVTATSLESSWLVQKEALLSSVESFLKR